MVFALCVLMVKTSRVSPTKQGILAAFYVGTTLLALIIIAGPKTGACFNPAVGLAMVSFEMANYGPLQQYKTFFAVYTLGPWVGALLAGIIHRGHLSAFALMNPGGNRVSKLIGDIKKGKKMIAGSVMAAEALMMDEQGLMNQ